MTRTEAIATITARLADADDETVKSVADFVQSLVQPVTASPPLRPLSAREHSLLEQAKEDFKAGRTYTLEESKARTDALFARYRAAKPTTI